MATKIVISRGPNGPVIKSVYSDSLDLAQMGVADIRRASHVEVRGHIPWWRFRQRLRLQHIPVNKWYADLAPSSGPILGPFDKRQQAIEAEVAWLEKNSLGGQTNVQGSEAEGQSAASGY